VEFAALRSASCFLNFYYFYHCSGSLSNARGTELGLTRTGCNVILQPSTRGSLGGSTISPLGWLHLGKDPAAATIVIAFVDYNNKVTLPFKAGPQFVTPRHEVQIPKMAPTVLTLAFEEGQPVNHQPPMSTTFNANCLF
jgi:hypothetical protein